MKQICLLILFVAVATAQDQVEVGPTEEVLVRCRRPLCEVACLLGQQRDSMGCPICACLQDPCQEAQCNPGEMCVRGADCPDKACSQLPYTCERVPCPQPMCAEACEFGMEKNEYGCETCTCRKNPCETTECLVEEECQVVDEDSCKPGAYCNKVGKCVAKQPANVQEEPVLPACPLIQCRMICRFGFKKNEQGCDLCMCKSSPCEDMQCAKGEKCTHNLDDECNRDICDSKPTCTMKPICEHMRDEHMDNMPMDMGMGTGMGMGMGQGMGMGMGMDKDMGMRRLIKRAAETVMTPPLQCDDHGNFKPMQCNMMTSECWCVNDLGVEIDGTRRSSDSQEMPTCAYNRTHSITGHLQLNHDIADNLDDHLDNLTLIVTKHLGEWMMIEEKYIQQVEITPSGDVQLQTIQVDFIVTGSIDEDIDLASSANHLRLTVQSEETIIQYQTFTLTPVSIEMEHQFQAEPIVEPVDDDDVDDGDYISSFCYQHRTGVIAAIIGIVLLLCTLVVLAILINKRRRLVKMQRMQNYRENLEFNNQMYGKLAFLDDIAKEKPPVEDISREAEA